LKVSSLSAGSADATLIQHHETRSILQMANRKDFSLLKQLDRIGTSIALGEAGNLEAAHEFRQKNSGL
jgi:hypothetical protein